MRGPKINNRRKDAQPAFPPNEATGIMVSRPAPVGGWNARDPLAAMPKIDAIVLDNFFPETGDVTLRPGKVAWNTGLTGNARSFLPYNGGAVQKLFISTTANIYDMTAAGVIGAAVATCTNGQWESVNFSNAGGTFLTAVNGVDSLKSYNGTTWTDITGASTPAITGVTTSTLSNLCLHKRRLWFVQNNSMNAWYLGTDAISGVATSFPMGAIFPRGGYIVAQIAWTVDGGVGLDDYFVTVTSEGELAIYQGVDPSSASTWGLVGVYYIGQPIGKKCLIKYGGDVLYLSQFGLVPLSKFLLANPQKPAGYTDESVDVSYKVDGALRASTILYGTIFGWQALIFPNVNALIVNIPQSVDGVSVQYVMNTITKAWCSFSGWSTNCMAVFKNELYQATGTNTYKAWVGTSDAGTPITGTMQMAYDKLDYNYQKNVSLVRPNIAVDNAATLSLAFDTDFKIFSGNSSVTSYTPPGGTALWDTGIWSTSVWTAGLVPLAASWTTVPNIPGYLLSFRLQLTTSSSKFSWTSTDFLVKRAGIL